MSEMNEMELMTALDVAQLFLVSEGTVTRWAREGRIPSLRTPGGQFRFDRHEIEGFFSPIHPRNTA